MVHTSSTVRPASEHDLESVWLLVRDFATSFQPEKEAFDASFMSMVRDNFALLVVVETSEKVIIGYLLAHCHSTFLANGPVAWVEEVMVDEQSRRQAWVRH